LITPFTQIGVAGLVAVFAALGSTLPALAHAGSTGGTIGKQGKSVSGGEEPTKPHQAAPATKSGKSIQRPAEREKSAGCTRIVGAWDWGFGFTRRFLPNGRIPSDDRGGGTWTCGGDNYVIKFADRSEDRLKV
jgi:hypothetical protein